MTEFVPRDYLSHLPRIQVNFKSPFLQVCWPFSFRVVPSSFYMDSLVKAEYERVARGERSIPLDVTRYHMPEPDSSAASELEAWQSAVRNAKAQLEHLNNRPVFSAYTCVYVSDCSHVFF